MNEIPLVEWFINPNTKTSTTHKSLRRGGNPQDNLYVQLCKAQMHASKLPSMHFLSNLLLYTKYRFDCTSYSYHNPDSKLPFCTPLHTLSTLDTIFLSTTYPHFIVSFHMNFKEVGYQTCTFPRKTQGTLKGLQCIVLLKCTSFWWSCPFWSMSCFVERYKVPKRTWSLEYDMIFFSTKGIISGISSLGKDIKCWQWICLGVSRVWSEIVHKAWKIRCWASDALLLGY